MGSEKRINLTKEIVEALPVPEKGQAFYRHGQRISVVGRGEGILDAKVRGFGVRVTANGAKSFIMERRVRGRVRRLTVARVGDLTIDQARAKAERLAAEIANDKDPVAEKKRRVTEALSLEEAVKDYLEDRTLKPRTQRDVRAAMKSLSGWSKRRLVDITPDGVLKRHKELSETSPARANLTMRYLRAIWNHARAKYAAPDGSPTLPPSPVTRLSDLKTWNVIERRKTVLKKADLKPWFRAVLGLRSETGRDFLQTVVLTGLRRSEALGLTWDRLDLKEGTLSIPASMTKAKRDHVLPLGDYLLELLRHRKANAQGPFVFADKLGRPFTNIRHALNAVKSASGIDFCLHDLRRTFATMAESLDISSFAVKRLLNHATNGDVTAGYIVADTERLRKPMQSIEDAILRLGGVVGGSELIPFPGQSNSGWASK